MVVVPATEFAKNFGRYRDVAQQEHVGVSSHDRVVGYFISSEEFEIFMRLKSLMPKAYAIEELSEETIRAIAASTMDARHNHLNDLLEDEDKYA